MILSTDLVNIGKVIKTHGVKGELSVSFLSPAVADAIIPGLCFIMDMDGIYTPFYVNALRPRGNESLLVMIDGMNTQEQAQLLVGHEVFVQKDVLTVYEDVNDEEEGMYAADLIGFKAINNEDKSYIGEIIDIDDNTENVLFVIEHQGQLTYIPVVDEFISQISDSDHTVTFDLPSGLLAL